MFRAIVLAIVISTSAVQAQDVQSCAFPLAATERVAVGIFNAIASGRQSAKKRRAYKTEVEDDGDSWSAFQVLKNGDSTTNFTDKSGQAIETVKVTAGGGGLEMTINKCTAVISNAHLSR